MSSDKESVNVEALKRAFAGNYLVESKAFPDKTSWLKKHPGSSVAQYREERAAYQVQRGERFAGHSRARCGKIVSYLFTGYLDLYNSVANKLAVAQKNNKKGDKPTVDVGPYTIMKSDSKTLELAFKSCNRIVRGFCQYSGVINVRKQSETTPYGPWVLMDQSGLDELGIRTEGLILQDRGYIIGRQLVTSHMTRLLRANLGDKAEFAIDGGRPRTYAKASRRLVELLGLDTERAETLGKKSPYGVSDGGDWYLANNPTALGARFIAKQSVGKITPDELSDLGLLVQVINSNKPIADYVDNNISPESVRLSKLSDGRERQRKADLRKQLPDRPPRSSGSSRNSNSSQGSNNSSRNSRDSSGGRGQPPPGVISPATATVGGGATRRNRPRPVDVAAPARPGVSTTGPRNNSPSPRRPTTAEQFATLPRLSPSPPRQRGGSERARGNTPVVAGGTLYNTPVGTATPTSGRARSVRADSSQPGSNGRGSSQPGSNRQSTQPVEEELNLDEV